MSGPHQLVSEARHAVDRALATFPAQTPVLVAVSGGSDSVALATTCAFIGRKQGREVHAICVDHGIRSESDNEASRVVAQMKALGVDATSVVVDATGTDGPEGSARNARYEAIATRARELGAVVALGHTLGDQAETVLLGLARGSGARSLAGMRSRGSLPGHSDVPMVRPLLGMSRDELRTVCTELGQTWIDDPTNELDGEWKTADGGTLRRISARHEVLPVMEDKLGPGISQALARTAHLLRDDDDALSAIAADVLEQVTVESEDGVAIDCAALASHPPAVRRRAIRRAMYLAGVRGGELTYWHVASVDRLVTSRDNKLGIDLPGIRAWRDLGVITFS